MKKRRVSESPPVALRSARKERRRLMNKIYKKGPTRRGRNRGGHSIPAECCLYGKGLLKAWEGTMCLVWLDAEGLGRDKEDGYDGCV